MAPELSPYVECGETLHLLDEDNAFAEPGCVRLACGTGAPLDRVFLVPSGIVDDACGRCEESLVFA